MTTTPEPLGYQSVRPLTSGLAVAASVCAACALPMILLYGAGIPIAILAFIFGLIARRQIINRPHELRGLGLAKAGIAFGAAGFIIPAMVIAALIPIMLHSREVSRRAYCAANLRGIMQSCNVYCACNADTFPVLNHPADITAGGTRYDVTTTAGTPGPVAETVITSMYEATYSAAPVYQNLWILVLKNQVAPKQFICPSDPVATQFGAAPTTIAGNCALTFTSNGATVDTRRISYSVAYPYTNTGAVGTWWKSVIDSSLPLISDIAPLSGETVGGITVNTAAIAGSPKSYNSRIHRGEGQNVGYSDVHASFERRPDVGSLLPAGQDNIFTSGGLTGPTSAGTGISTGGTITPITRNEAPWDTIMVPVRDASGVTR